MAKKNAKNQKLEVIVLKGRFLSIAFGLFFLALAKLFNICMIVCWTSFFRPLKMGRNFAFGCVLFLKKFIVKSGITIYYWSGWIDISYQSLFTPDSNDVYKSFEKFALKFLIFRLTSSEQRDRVTFCYLKLMAIKFIFTESESYLSRRLVKIIYFLLFTSYW